MFERLRGRIMWLPLVMLAWGGEAELAGRAMEPHAQPNILVITLDNLGYGDLQSYNPQSTIRTPHLDRLAERGTRLTSFYTASPTCTVSRACLLTGRLPERHGLREQLAGVAGNYGVGLNQQELLVPQLLKRATPEYVTGCFGKWNIGFAPGSRPTERGFDEFIGHASGNMDYYHHNYRHKHDLYRGEEEYHRPGEYSSDLFADAAIDFMQRHAAGEQPWFVYLPFNAPHFPTADNKIRGEPNVWQAPDWAFEIYGLTTEETDPARRYAAVVTALDHAIGRVLGCLDQTGQAEQTFVFLYSDNGTFRLNREGLDVGSNHPLRSGGITCWEGGLRVPAFAVWPGHIAAGVELDEPFWSLDLLNACLELAGVPLPDDRTLDGMNPLPLLTQRTASPHRSFYFNYRNHSALRMGDWKIVREHPNRPWQLFDLRADLAESSDLAAQHPDRLQALLRERGLWDATFETASDLPEVD